jgi:DNA-binding NarL/FixJ family response regulator
MYDLECSDREKTMVGRQILIVDDNPLLARLSHALLAKARAKSTCIDLAHSVADALNLQRDKAYDLLVINGNGDRTERLDILRQLRAAQCDASAVVIIGWLTPGVVDLGRQLGVSRFFRLPADFQEYVQHLNTF